LQRSGSASRIPLEILSGTVQRNKSPILNSFIIAGLDLDKVCLSHYKWCTSVQDSKAPPLQLALEKGLQWKSGLKDYFNQRIHPAEKKIQDLIIVFSF
jgi:hypothetical protein